MRLGEPLLRLRAADGDIRSLPMEEYLHGVLMAELGPNWPQEALKAQAVAARSFAWQRMENSRRRDYDMRVGVLDQAYQPTKVYPLNILLAVETTEGEILTYNGQPAETLYHAICSGHTADVSKIFNRSIPYLRGVACSYCRGAPRFAWQWETDLGNWNQRLSLDPQTAGPVRIARRDGHGRALEVAQGSTSPPRRFAVEEVRNKVGYSNLRSNRFTIRQRGQQLFFAGFGSGHGVGLCQWGSRQQALNGRKYRDILAYYYPGTVLEKRY